MPGAGASGGSSGRPALRTATTRSRSPRLPPAFAAGICCCPRAQLLQRALGDARPSSPTITGLHPALQLQAPTGELCLLRGEVLLERGGPGSCPAAVGAQVALDARRLVLPKGNSPSAVARGAGTAGRPASLGSAREGNFTLER